MDLSKTRLLITGATGGLGKQLLYELNKRGVSPVVQVRKHSDTRYVDKLGLEKRICDLCDEGALEGLLQGVEAVINCAAWVNFRQDRLTQFTNINCQAPVNLYRVACKLGVKRFLQVSTIAAVGAIRFDSVEDRKHGAAGRVSEETEFNLSHLRIPYIMTKRAAEEELLKLADKAPTELVIVNPSIIVAPSRSGDDRSKARKGIMHPVLPAIRNRVNLVDIRDVAPGIISALVKGQHRHRYILAGDNIEAKELLLAASSILGRWPHLMAMPRGIFHLMARVALWFTRISGRSKVSFYPDLVRMLDFDWSFSSLKARRELGYRNRSLHVTLENLLSNNFTGTWQKP